MSDRDLVERLRSPEVFLSVGGMVSPVAYAAARRIEEQAAEITRLRAEVARRTATEDVLRDEITRLRKAMTDASSRLTAAWSRSTEDALTAALAGEAAR